MRPNLSGSGEIMNENGLSRRTARARIAQLVLCSLLGFAWFGASPAQAAAAKRFVLTPQEARLFEVWSNYLAKGPQTWSTTHAPAFTPAIKTTIWQVLKTDTQAQQLQNPMIDYLLWRRSLNPVRFTANHPNLSPALAQLLNTPQLPPNVPPPTYAPVPQTSSLPQGITPPDPLIPPATQSVAPQNVAPPAVPEPGSLILAAGLIGWGLWWRRRLQQAEGR
jgi:hypothetical protein